ncbi:MAG: SRPBCC domain-containing protein [Chromatiales bacterium]|jgi:uncharacterized protein YndB with AHSA1/START domain
MAEIVHQIGIDGTDRAVYHALTTSEGLACWWTDDVQAEAREGSVATFGFSGHSVVFRMEVSELVPGRRVRWHCLGDFDEWTGTDLAFDIEEAVEGGVVLCFTHAGWATTEGAYRHCNTDWGRLMYSLKDHIEGRGQGPFMH